MKVYNTFDDVDTDLKRFDLERKIAREELKLVQGKVEKDLQPINLIVAVLKVIGKVGMFKLLKKIIR
ncbi:hypothetical protein FJ651_05045 [Paucihalobacter ruber]|uniref:Glutaminyl-tRNA synthetase n=1 Tax=Paucihalobacter ruber TaxID=2567861 RepID=A0A506PME8_9FLAO|nr:hypothetical protein [Paucihalobacter ruber]TPV34901.1 hypothetical protein FJ651_05045 [Paucihalobacter ruber]